jgi:WD40 repeat protein
MTSRVLTFPGISPLCPYDWFSFGDGDRLVAASDVCGHVVVVNTQTRKLVVRRDFVGFLDLGPAILNRDGTEMAVANSANPGQVALVKLATDKIIAVLTGDTKAIQSLAFSPNGNLIATASLDDTVRIWNARTGQLLRILDHPDGVYNVAFSPDGTQVSTLDYAGVIRIFPTCPAECTNPKALLALARARVTRSLTPQEDKEFGIP